MTETNGVVGPLVRRHEPVAQSLHHAPARALDEHLGHVEECVEEGDGGLVALGGGVLGEVGHVHEADGNLDLVHLRHRPQGIALPHLLRGPLQFADN